ncbi:hypothetical protein TIFTF001_053447 [Ficus carica]|uniref:Uncharacterized protein n=1 Tax=Ficus carica TaxID=3494 RepID=A0AA88ED83_FICCA|nr:hypothetical protein TIFTF001_053447 [Ficus carica]
MDSGELTRWHSGVMRDDLSGPRAPTPATNCPGYTVDIDDTRYSSNAEGSSFTIFTWSAYPRKGDFVVGSNCTINISPLSISGMIRPGMFYAPTNPNDRALDRPGRMLLCNGRSCSWCHRSALVSYRELLIEFPKLSSSRRSEKINYLPSSFNISDHLSDSENDNLSRDVDFTGSSSSIVSLSSDTTGEAVEQGARTSDYLSDIYDIPSPDRSVIPTTHAREVAQVQSALVVDLTANGVAASERTVSQANTSGREGSESSESTAPAGEPVQSRQRGRSRPLRINGLLVYRMADTEMVDREGDHSVYTLEYFTSAVTS